VPENNDDSLDEGGIDEGLDALFEGDEAEK